MTGHKKITVVSPCYNEEDNVEICYNTVKAIFDEHLPGYEREHIFVDNASSDRTVEILRGLSDADASVKVIVNARNFGVFKSTFNGLRYSTGDATLLMLPVDLQDPPDLLPEFVGLWEQGYDVVAGARSTREEGIILRFFRKAFYRIVNQLSEFEIERDVGEFQLVDRKVLDAVLRHRDNYPYIRGIVASVGFKRITRHYTWKEREHGKSKHNYYMMLDHALNAIFAFTRAPMRFCTIVGFIISTTCILFSLLSVVLFLFDPTIAPRGTTTIIVALFFLSGIQMLFIGMLGEYITSIQAQVRGGPMVIEKELININETAIPTARDTTGAV